MPAWGIGGPGAGRLGVDVDPTICHLVGTLKQGAAFGCTRVLGYHPILASNTLPRGQARSPNLQVSAIRLGGRHDGQRQNTPVTAGEGQLSRLGER